MAAPCLTYISVTAICSFEIVQSTMVTIAIAIVIDVVVVVGIVVVVVVDVVVVVAAVLVVIVFVFVIIVITVIIFLRQKPFIISSSVAAITTVSTTQMTYQTSRTENFNVIVTRNKMITGSGASCNQLKKLRKRIGLKKLHHDVSCARSMYYCCKSESDRTVVGKG